MLSNVSVGQMWGIGGGVNPEETLVGILDGNRVGVFWGVTVSDVNYYGIRLETDLLAECFTSDHENDTVYHLRHQCFRKQIPRHGNSSQRS
jgi:hypothetical protein